jgi:hypothetical protein
MLQYILAVKHHKYVFGFGKGVYTVLEHKSLKGLGYKMLPDKGDKIGEPRQISDSSSQSKLEWYMSRNAKSRIGICAGGIG